ncbi:GNAT family N-acetyltransferase [Mycoplana rhizolycopersici]|uniref:GNAT family N-acetyltransferase n=1 Tax=Mycoplana rhizolycopersici TaxID=2746702 RepID=A0ABX2QHJ7_9HYPH|nr:GNAT family N-acetyltransferase [Rhizobium rhizolycopersici]NVP56402.1 GNAT family N-acetyltransferase [Rhizobium rhizolycopersici]
MTTGVITRTGRLTVRNWIEGDRDLFHEINSDPEVMRYFPFRRSRAQSDELFDRLRAMIGDTGFGFFAIALRGCGRPIGFCGLARTDLAPFLPDGTVEIGWRLARSHWGHGYVTEAASALLAHGFERCGLEEIVSFAVPDNARSTSVMTRIGMRRDPGRDFDHPRVPDSHPHLIRHALYAITRSEWQTRRPASMVSQAH